MTVRLHKLLTPGRTWMLFVLFRAAGGSHAFQPLVVKISITKTIQILLHYIQSMGEKNLLPEKKNVTCPSGPQQKNCTKKSRTVISWCFIVIAYRLYGEIQLILTFILV